MPRKRQPGHHYSVYILAYADAVEVVRDGEVVVRVLLDRRR